MWTWKNSVSIVTYIIIFIDFLIKTQLLCLLLLGSESLRRNLYSTYYFVSCNTENWFSQENKWLQAVYSLGSYNSYNSCWYCILIAYVKQSNLNLYNCIKVSDSSKISLLFLEIKQKCLQFLRDSKKNSLCTLCRLSNNQFNIQSAPRRNGKSLRMHSTDENKWKSS